MKRRSFLAALAALPFMPKALAALVEPKVCEWCKGTGELLMETRVSATITMFPHGYTPPPDPIITTVACPKCRPGIVDMRIADQVVYHRRQVYYPRWKPFREPGPDLTRPELERRLRNVVTRRTLDGL